VASKGSATIAHEQAERDRAHGLAESVVYGPLSSRRYGLDYGVNLLPAGRKHCNWNCVYCQLGYTRLREEEVEGFPSPEALEAALAGLPAAPEPAAFVVCGNGEPTLHPRFPDMVDVLVRARDAAWPRARLVALTNGGEAWRPSVLKALRRFDEVGLKLDAGAERLFNKVNLPIRPASVEHQIRTSKRLEGAVIQSCFFEGPVDNSSDEAVGPWLDAVTRAMPRRVDLYTISRSTPSRKLRPVSDARLRTIARWAEARVEGTVRAFGRDGPLA
jgi:wyosine [tRNA(Phe)-imidazoG37] synthetase (radical SAM superfamily)